MDSRSMLWLSHPREFLEADWPRFEGINADAKGYLTMESSNENESIHS
jgi:hypothetical protein